MVHAVHVSFHLISFPLVYHEQPKSSICCSRVTEVIKLSIYFVCPLKGPSANSNSKCIQPSETGLFSFLKCKYFDVQVCKKVSCSLYHDPPFSHCSTLLFFRFRFAHVSRPILHPHTYWNLIWYHWLIAQVWPPPGCFMTGVFLWDHCGPSSSERSDSPTAAVRMNGSFPRRGMMKRIQFL